MTGGTRPAIVNKLVELTGWKRLMVLKKANRRQKKSGLRLLIAVRVLRCGLYPKRRIPTINIHSTGKSGPLAEFIVEDIYVSAVKENNIRLIDADGSVPVATEQAKPTSSTTATAKSMTPAKKSPNKVMVY